MSDRVAIVADAGGPLGRAAALKLGAAGFSVVGIDRNEDGLRELPEGIRRLPGDTTDPAIPKSLVDRVAAEIGPPDMLVNTIGAFVRRATRSRRHPTHLRLMMDVNAGTALWLTQAVVPHMRERGSGAITFTCPPAELAEPYRGCGGVQPEQGGPEPSGAGAGPGAASIGDQGQRGRAAADRHSEESDPVPAGRIWRMPLSPEAIADLIVFLVGDAAAPVSGAVLPAYGA